jgi:hypothetical protein
MRGKSLLAPITAPSLRQIRGHLDAPISTPDFENDIRGPQEHFDTLSVESADLFAKKTLKQYAAV